MRYRGSLLLALISLAISFHCSAQDVLPVDEATLVQHIAHRVDPVYPADAKTAHVEGTVVFEIQVGTTGKIESMNVVSGPDLLRQAATDCLKQWSYYPFEKDDSPVLASGPVFIEFSLAADQAAAGKAGTILDKGKSAPNSGSGSNPIKEKPAPAEGKTEEKIAERFAPAAEECRKDLAAGTDYRAAFDACRKAVEIAEEFAPDHHFIEKRSAFVSAAWASMYGGYMKAALTYATKAVDEVKLGHDDDSGSNAAFGVKGIVEGKLGELTAADQDLAQAEDYGRKGIASAEKDAPDTAGAFKQPFVLELRFHAQILQALSRTDEAQKKLDEAAQYE